MQNAGGVSNAFHKMSAVRADCTGGLQRMKTNGSTAKHPYDCGGIPQHIRLQHRGRYMANTCQEGPHRYNPCLQEHRVLKLRQQLQTTTTATTTGHKTEQQEQRCASKLSRSGSRRAWESNRLAKRPACPQQPNLYLEPKWLR